MKTNSTGCVPFAALCAALLCGCASVPQTLVKPQTVEVPTYLRMPLPAEVIKDCVYVEPDPACWRDGHREYCNAQLLEVRLGYRTALDRCNADKAALRALGGSNGQ